MARGRHARRGLLSRLWLSRRRRPVAAAVVAGPAPGVDAARFAALEGEVSRLRVLGIAHAAAAASADIRARRAEEQLTTVHAELAGLRGELVGLRGELSSLREDLVWAFAEGRLPVAAPVAVVDLRDGARTA